jgi:hypothetical protein
MALEAAIDAELAIVTQALEAHKAVDAEENAKPAS